MKQILKKSLSVFLSLLMVFTSLVFVVPEFKASAVSAGTYDYRVRLVTTNSADVGDDKDLEFTLTYKTENGTSGTTGTVTKTQPHTWASADGADNTFDFEDVPGFPTKLNTYCLLAFTVAVTRRWDATITVSVKNQTTGEWVQIATESFSQSGSAWGQTDVNFTINSFDGTPKASSINWVDAPTTDQTIGKTSNVTKTFRYTVLDQYGVTMSTTALKNLGVTPVTTVTGSESGTIGTSTSNDIYHTATDTASYFQEVITAKPTAQGETWDYQTITTKVAVGSSLTSSMAYTLYDNKYTYTLNANTGSFLEDEVTHQEKYYYNTYGNLPTPTKEGYTFRGFYTEQDEDFTDELPLETSKLTANTPMTSDTEWFASWKINQYTSTFKYRDPSNAEYVTESNTSDYGSDLSTPEIEDEFVFDDVKYTFSAWSPVVPSTVPAESKTYEAQYNTEKLYADYQLVDEAVAAAEEKMADAEYEVMYTEASRGAVKSAIDNVIYQLGLSKQETVNGYAQAINDAVAKLEKSKFVVLFVDEDGSIIKNGYHFVEYGTALEVPANPEKEADNVYHYEFSGWDEDTSACEKVVEDLVFTATFAEIRHTWSSETIPSTCTTDGAVKYTCSGCDYSYTVASSTDTAGHTWKEEKDTVIEANCGKDGLKATFCEVCGVMDENTLEIVEAEDGDHTWSVAATYTAATCTGSGTNKSVCAVCGEEKYEIVKPTGHQNGTAIVVAPTCTADGYTYVECQVCGHQTVTAEEPTTGHSLATTRLAPTCVKTGYEKIKCSKCDYEKITIIQATGAHNVPSEWTTVKEPTCNTAGLKHRECSLCKAEDEYELIDATGEHSYGDWVTETEPSCGKTGLKRQTCTVCKVANVTEEIDALEHVWIENPANSKDATCEGTGIYAEICSNCSDTREDVTSKLGHNYVETNSTVADCTHGATKTFTCTNDETHTYTVITALANGHSYAETTKQYANCTDPEIKVYTCSCGESYEEITAVPNGHTWDDNWVVTVQPTETTTGKQVRYCTVCNNAYEESTIPATSAHIFEEDTTKYVPATCTASGLKVYVCTTHENCEANYTETIKAEGHNVVMESQPATCTAEGYVKAYCDKNGCGTVIGESKIPMLSHSYTVEVTSTNATCNRDGETEYRCATCEATTTVVTPKTGHTYTKAVTQNKDCTKAEITTYTCHCGHHYTEITAVPTGHNFIDNWEEKTPATADAAGELIRYCTRGCGAYETAPISPNGGHEFVVDDTASKAATCTEAGLTVYKCTNEHNCGVTYEHVIAATGHSESLIYQPATCDADGYTMTVCSTCQNVVDAGHKISKLGHKYVGEITTAAGCGTKGVITYTCQNDASHTYTEEIKALQHDFSVEVEGTRVAPTCITDGSVTKKCLHCDATQFEVISKTGHDYLNGVVIEAGDCVTAGKIEYTCENDPTHKFTEVTPPTGAHDYTGNDRVVYAATCTTGEKVTQYCNNCKNHVVISEGEPLGHDWSEWVVIKEATDDEYAVQERTCQRKGCGETETMTLTPGRTFKITFYDFESVRITKPTVYNYGSAAVRPEIPLRMEDAVFVYEFEGWRYSNYTFEETEKMLDYLGYGWDYSKVEGDDGFDAQENDQKEMAFVAQYKKTEKVYKVNYCDSYGNVIHTIDNVLYSDVHTAWDVIPTKESTEQYDYTFSEWHVKYDTDPITGENVATATAIYTKTVRPDYEGPSEPTLFDKIIQSIRDFFNKILSFLGLGV